MTAPRPLATRLLAALATGVLSLALAAVGAAPAGATDATLDPRAAPALTWLSGQLDANHGALQFDGGFGPDYGLTADAVLALAAGGQAHSTSADTAMSALAAHISSYVTDADFGPGTDRYAGPLAKALLAAEVTGHDFHAFGGMDLEAELRARLQGPTDPDPGRFSDLIHDTTFGSDFSNGLGQALAVLALQRTDAGIPPAAITWLLAQQCPAGGFRLFYDTGTSCTADSDIDTDATAFAVQALAVAGGSSTVTTALNEAVSWLLSVQDPATGAFAGVGPTAVLNANTTGVVAAALRQEGKRAEANKAAGWIVTLQLTASNAGAAAADAGAILYDPADRDDAIANGITSTRGKVQRATAQGVLAIGLPAYGQIGTVDPVLAADPVPAPPPPAPTATTSTPTVSVSSPVTVTGTGFAPAEVVDVTLHSTPVALGTATADNAGGVTFTFTMPAVEAGSHVVELRGEQSGATALVTISVVAGDDEAATTPGAAVSGSQLARSGRATGFEVQAGLELIAAGGLLLLAADRRRRRFASS